MLVRRPAFVHRKSSATILRKVALISKPLVSGYWTHLDGGGGGGGIIRRVVRAKARSSGLVTGFLGSYSGCQSPIAVTPSGATCPKTDASIIWLVVVFQPNAARFVPAEAESQ